MYALEPGLSPMLIKPTVYPDIAIVLIDINICSMKTHCRGLSTVPLRKISEILFFPLLCMDHPTILLWSGVVTAESQVECFVAGTVFCRNKHQATIISRSAVRHCGGLEHGFH